MPSQAPSNFCLSNSRIQTAILVWTTPQLIRRKCYFGAGWIHPRTGIHLLKDSSSFILKVAETRNQIIIKLLKLGYQSILSFGRILKFLGPAQNGV